MAIAKSLYEAPMGLGALDVSPEEDISVVTDDLPDDPESMLLSLGVGKDSDIAFDANLAEELSDGDLQSLASELLADYDADVSSRKDWLDTYIKGLDLLGLKYEERTEQIGRAHV